MNAGEFLSWHDLFVVVDDGSIPLARYGAIEAAMRERAKAFPRGIANLTILPVNARPPPENVKRAVKSLLTRIAPTLSSLSYLIEGTGFKGVAARATLVGMKIFASRPYPIYVEVSLHEVLRKILPHLHGGNSITTDVNVIAQVINDARMGPIRPPLAPEQESVPAK